MTKTFNCSCYQCGHHWQHNSQKLHKDGGATCPSCGLWLPVADDAKERVKFVSAVDKAGGGSIVSGKDFIDAFNDDSKTMSEIPNDKKSVVGIVAQYAIVILIVVIIILVVVELVPSPREELSNNPLPQKQHLIISSDGKLTEDYIREVATKAAEQELAEAQYDMALTYSRGEGVPQDYKQAFKWFKKAAEQGHIEAQISLADMYYGKGVPPDYEQVVKWLTKAAEQGDVRAQEILAHTISDEGRKRWDDMHKTEWRTYSPFQVLKEAEMKPSSQEDETSLIADAVKKKTRTWTLADGKNFEAEFVTLIGDRVVLRTLRRKQVMVPINKFSREDRQYIHDAVP